jgi:hypothetical protein
MKEMPGTSWALTVMVNEGKQIVPVIQGLLESKDEKVRLRILEVLLDGAYSGNSGRELAVQPERLQWSIPRPERDWGEIMASLITSGSPKMIFIGEVTQIAGVAAVVGGVVLSMRHWPAALALVGGLVAYFVGKKLRGA